MNDKEREHRHVSAFELDIVREAFRKLVGETNIAEEHWATHARRLFQEMGDGEPDETMINWIIGAKP